MPLKIPSQSSIIQQRIATETSRIRNANRQSFWGEFIEYNKRSNGLYSNSTGTTDSWLGKSIKGLVGANINILIYNNQTRSEVYINTGDKTKNKELFDYLFSHKTELEQDFGEELTWQRMSDKVTCRISIDRKDLSYLNPEDREKSFIFSQTRLIDLWKRFLLMPRNTIVKCRFKILS